MNERFGDIVRGTFMGARSYDNWRKVRWARGQGISREDYRKNKLLHAAKDSILTFGISQLGTALLGTNPTLPELLLSTGMVIYVVKKFGDFSYDMLTKDGFLRDAFDSLFR